MIVAQDALCAYGILMAISSDFSGRGRTLHRRFLD